MKREIFISYKSSSILTVEKLAKVFENNDIYCWYAPRNLNEDGLGKEFDDEIVDAIKNSSAVVVLLNDQALTSKWVKRELTQAEKYGKMILPFVIDELTVENGLFMRLEDKHMITAYPTPEDKFPILLNSVQHLLGKVNVSRITDSNDEPNNDKPERGNGGGSPDIYDLDYEEGLAFLEADEETDAFMAFLRSAERHNSKAYEQLFKIMHRNNKSAEFLNEETWEHIEELSDVGEGFADLLMHYRYFGMGTQNDIAIKYLKRALAKNVSPYAFLQMGICYYWGLGVELSDIQGRHYYLKAYEAGCWDATGYLAQMYQFGGEKIAIDYALAEKYGKEGVEKGVPRCYSQLSDLYVKLGRKDDALQLIQGMIDQGVKGGYFLMGEYYTYAENDYEKAKKWYIQAIEHNDKKAWGMLSWISWTQDDNDEAFRLAKKGVHLADSFSYFMLGYLYENTEGEEHLEKAWECYMDQVHKFGTSADVAASLYLEKGYQPTEEQIEDLKHYLILDSQQQRIGSIKALLKIILIEKQQKPELTYEALRGVPETYEFLCRGAEARGNDGDNAELQYIYSKILLGDSGKYHNPYKGEKIMLEAARNGEKEAISYIFHNASKEEKQNLAHALIQAKRCPELHIEQVAQYGSEIATKEELLAWIPKALETIQDKDEWICARCTLYAIELDIYKEDNDAVSTFKIHSIQEYVRKHLALIIGTGALSKLKKHIHFLFPNYDPATLMNGKFSDNEQFELFFGLSHTGMEIQKYASGPLEKHFYEYLRKGLDAGEQLPDKIIQYDELKQAYSIMLDSYNALLKRGLADAINESIEFTPEELTPCCTTDTAIEHMRRALKMLLASHRAYGDKWPEIFKILGNDDETLNWAEKLTDPDAQLLLIEYVEVSIEAESKTIDNDELRIIIEGKDIAKLYNKLNESIKQMNDEGIKHHLKLLELGSPLPEYFAKIMN